MLPDRLLRIALIFLNTKEVIKNYLNILEIKLVVKMESDTAQIVWVNM